MAAPDADSPGFPRAHQPSPSDPPRVTTEALFGSGPEVLIVHGADTYRLRITRTGKLILTK